MFCLFWLMYMATFMTKNKQLLHQETKLIKALITYSPEWKNII